MKQLEIYFFALCFCCCVCADAQVRSDSTHLLEPVLVSQSRLNDYVLGAYQLPIDSSVMAISLNGSVTDLLRKQGFGHLRAYGPNGLASPSFRGTGSSHTAVLWNGINLVSPLLGQLDLSLLPAGFFDDAFIQTGGSSSLSGNGSIGANIHLNNNLHFNEGLQIAGAQYAGSYDNYLSNIRVKFSNSNFGTSTNLFYNESENNFPFKNRNINPAITQNREHNGFSQHGILQQFHLQSQNAGIFSLKFWYQDSRYEVPNATSINRVSKAVEQNKFNRILAGWNFSKGGFDINYQGAFLTHALDYSDGETNLSSLSKSTTVVQNAEVYHAWENKNSLTTGIHYTWEEGDVEAYGNENPQRNRVAVFGAFKMDALEKLKFALSFRDEFVNGSGTPLAPTVSIRYVNKKNSLEFFTNFSRNYRLQTFNDLYWRGSGARGNPDLKPEHSLGGEAGMSAVNSFLFFKICAFHNYIDNWILWSPDDNAVWIPQNIKKVRSRGLESQFTLKTKLRKGSAKLSGQYSFTKSTNEDIYDNGNPNEIGKQLILTPLHEGSVTGEVQWRKFSFRFVTSYTGQQFNDSDNTPYNILKDYVVTNVWLSKNIVTKKFQYVFIGEINNLFDEEYQARPGYPLPGINYKLGIQIIFNKPNKI